MSTNAGHVSGMREEISTWLAQFENNEKKVEIGDLKQFVELFGFVTTVEHNAEGNQIQSLIVTTAVTKDEQGEKTDAQQSSSPTKEPTSPSHRSPLNDIEISINVPSSSPIKQYNKASDTLMKILNLAKEALENEANSTFTKPAFLHKRISDIKISPLAMNTSSNRLTCDLNVTKTKESPTILKSTPKKKGAVIVKPKEEKKANVSVGFKKNVFQPVQSNLQALRSKLRTPTQLKAPGHRISAITSSPVGTRSIGSLSRISMSTAEKRISTTPLKKDIPLGFSRLKYPSAVKK